MRTATFETRVLPDGHLDCPEEFSRREDAKFLVTVTFEDVEASDEVIEAAAVQDLADDEFLSREEVDYYMGLEEL